MWLLLLWSTSPSPNMAEGSGDEPEGRALVQAAAAAQPSSHAGNRASSSGLAPLRL